MSLRKVLLDTCVFSELSKHPPHDGVLRWLLGVGQIAISMGVVIEVEKGIADVAVRSPAKALNLRRWLNSWLSNDLPLLASNVTVSRLYGKMMGTPALRSLWADDPKALAPRFCQDLHIAAAAIVYGYELATYDISHFERIDHNFRLPGLVNPKSQPWTAPTEAESKSNFLNSLWKADRI